MWLGSAELAADVAQMALFSILGRAMDEIVPKYLHSAGEEKELAGIMDAIRHLQLSCKRDMKSPIHVTRAAPLEPSGSSRESKFKAYSVVSGTVRREFMLAARRSSRAPCLVILRKQWAGSVTLTHLALTVTDNQV